VSELIPSELDGIIETAVYVWCTTIRADGVPQPTPIWFLRDEDSFYFYTPPDSQKVKNLATNAHIALSFADDVEGEIYFVVTGTAHIDTSLPSPVDNEPYMTKYGAAHYMTETTPAKYAQIFSLPIRVVPARVRGQ